MKKWPYPDKDIKTKDQVRRHFEELIFNALSWLKIDGYTYVTLVPGDADFRERDGAGVCIVVAYPYKKFAVSIQQDSLDKAFKEKRISHFWENVEDGVFHECFHILVWELAEIARMRYATFPQIENSEEALVDHLTHILMPLVKDSRRAKNK